MRVLSGSQWDECGENKRFWANGYFFVHVGVTSRDVLWCTQ